MEYSVKDITILRIASYDTKRDGTPLVTKPKFGGEGKPYKKIMLTVDSNCIDDMEFNGQMSMLDFDGLADDWSEGDKISGKIIHDGDYWNFELPKVDLRAENENLKQENAELKRQLEAIKKGDSIDGSDSIDDLPF